MDFQNGRHGGHLGFLIRKNLAILIYESPQSGPPILDFQSELIYFFLSTSYPDASRIKSISLSVQEKK